jgi:hypothetical protein
VVRVIRDHDGDWQAMDAAPRGEGDGCLIALRSLLELHPDTEEAVAALDRRDWGWQAIRGAGGWTVSRLPEPQD